MSKLYQDTKRWVEENCFNAKHLVRSAYWVKKLEPKANKAVLIAALTHDVDRGLSRLENHEFGGTYEQDLVRDADSISFLEVAPPAFIKFIPQKRTKDEVRIKFKFMYERITLPKAKKLAKSFLKKAMAELEKVKE